MGPKRLFPGKNEMGMGLMGKELGSGSLGPWGAWVPWMGEATGSMTSFIQPPAYTRWSVTQSWTPPRPLFSRSVTLLQARLTPGPLSRAIDPP